MQRDTIHSWEIPNRIVRYVKANPFVNLEGVWNRLLPCLFRSDEKYQSFQKNGFIRKENHFDFTNHREYEKRGIYLALLHNHRRIEGVDVQNVYRIESKGMEFVVMESINNQSKILPCEFQLLVRFRKTSKCRFCTNIPFPISHICLLRESCRSY